jgi:hypothetical protein
MLHLLNDLKNFDQTEDAYPFGEYHHAVMKEDFRRNSEKLFTKTNEDLVIKTEPDIEDCFRMTLVISKSVR